MTREPIRALPATRVATEAFRQREIAAAELYQVRARPRLAPGKQRCFSSEKVKPLISIVRGAPEH